MDQAAAAGRHRRPWWRTPRAGVATMVVALLAVSALAWALDLTGAGGAPLSPVLPWWVLAPLFALAEVVVLHVQVRREAQAVSLSEIPLVLAVYLATPADMLLATVVGTGLVYAVYRRQSPVKAVFNTTLRVFGVSAALVVFHGIAGPDAAAAHGPVGWAAALAGVSLAGAADGLLVLAVVGLHEGRVERGEIVTALVRYPVISAVVACAGVLIVTALHADPRTTPLLLVVGAAIMIAYRAHASLNDRHVSLAQLYDFGRAVTGSHAADEILASALLGARALLKAEAAEVVLLGDEPGQLPRRWTLAPGSAIVRSDEVADGTHAALWHSVLRSGRPVLTTHGGPAHEQAAHAEQLAALGYREAVVVALRDESRVLGSLMVAERMGEVRAFQVDDIATLETVANQAGLALAKGRLLDRMQHEALHDVLTGLANRTKFRDAVQQSLHQVAAGAVTGFTVLLIDLDGFKEVNDSLGHHHGDVLLVHVAEALVAAAPPAATVSRLGGDEFAVLLPQTDSVEDAVLVASRVHERLGAPVVIEDIEVRVRASVGVALAPVHGDDVSSLLRAADSAMYRAKVQQGGTQVHDDGSRRPPSADPAAHTRLALLADLRRAVADGRIDIHVQPQADATSGDVIGVEALVRWQHPRLGVLPPADFLALAERHGLMPDVTALVLDRAVSAAQAWRAGGLDLAVSVNLPARALADDRTLAMVDAALARSGLPAGRLTLEITEDSVIGDPERAIALLERLRGRGVRLSVDDFGTGYSSLSYLRRLPVDEVKIDRSFVAHLTHDTHDLLIARSIIDLGTNLALDVVVEGVEDQQTWDHLAALGAHTIQGYHLARPMPVEELVPWLHGYNTFRRTPRSAAVPAQGRRRTPSAPRR
ncbi:EAL domain-containing protein [Kineosporia sp. R_H_3]|uniref:EAL domain-containing protein n=1 Tax=Kineosporia sp. R_H_3 TaxID=1961848 RepID=UPI00117B5121|nr:EAL domain-containing protein [Kineosporia sp. R_H_3]